MNVYIFSLIFTTGSALILFISGFFKILSIKSAVELVLKFKFFPRKMGIPIGYLFPFVEILIAIYLLFNKDNLYINILTILIISVFVVINSKAIIEKMQMDCHCFGNIIKTKVGIGGLVQSLLMFLSILPNLFIVNSPYNSILFFEYSSIEFLILFSISVIWTITLILIRMTIDKFSY